MTAIERRDLTPVGEDLSPARGQAPGVPELSDDHYRLLVDCAVDALAVIDATAVCTWANATFTTLLGWRPEDLVGINLLDLVHPDDLGKVVDELSELLAVDTTFVPSYFRARRGDGTYQAIEVLARLLPSGSDLGVALVTVRDASTLQQRLDFAAMVDRLAEQFIGRGTTDLDTAISQALGEMGRFIGADRAYLFTLHAEEGYGSNTHEWCADGIEPQIDRLRRQPFSEEPNSYGLLAANEIVHITDFSALGQEWAGDRDSFEQQTNRAVLRVPFSDGEVVRGFLGFDMATPRVWSPEDMSVLRPAASLLSQVLARQEAERELESTRIQVESAFRDAPVPLAVAGPDSRYVQVNPAFCELLGYTEGELIGQCFYDITHPDDHIANETVLATLALSSGRNSFEIEKRFLHRDGTPIWTSVNVRAVRDDTSEVRHTIAHVQDISGRKVAEAALEQSERRFRTLVDNLPDPVIRIGKDGRRNFANVAAQRLTAMSPDSARGLRSEQLGFSAELARSWRRGVAQVLRDGSRANMEFTLPTPTGDRYFQTSLVPEFAPDGTLESVLAVSRDLSELKATEAELAHQALHDPLTGLPNRKLFLSHLERAVARLQRHASFAAVLFFDLDRFKVVNDSLGHSAGDELLMVAAQRIRAALRPEDTVARLGGDEFTVLLEGLRSPAEAVHAAERLQRALGGPASIGGYEVFCSTSIGIALATSPETDPLELLRNADTAMYRAKERGRSRCELFDDELHAAVTERLEMENGLRHAIDRDEFEVWYQPEVDLVTGRTVAMEALVRWQHPTRGLLPAGAFIGLAEETGLILSIGRWVMHQACRQLAQWNAVRAEQPITMRINLSALQLSDRHLVSTVKSAFEATGVQPENVCFEITETALMGEPEAGLAVLRELRSLGVSLALDDFGTGYSSLAYLKRFPLDVLKIDRSFVDGLPDDIEDVAIVTTIVLLAETLGLSVTAEGIETQAHLQTLRSLGCQTGQGYYFAKPAPPEIAETFLSC